MKSYCVRQRSERVWPSFNQEHCAMADKIIASDTHDAHLNVKDHIADGWMSTLWIVGKRTTSSIELLARVPPRDEADQRIGPRAKSGERCRTDMCLHICELVRQVAAPGEHDRAGIGFRNYAGYP
jgi:hypothetical protein